MGALLEDPYRAQTHPQPCTDTPWPGVECELSNSNQPIFHVTKIHIGPDIVFPFQPCKPSAYLSQSLMKLKYIKTLSIFDCFGASPVILPKTLFGPFTSLEHLALENNPSLCGDIPTSLGGVTGLRLQLLQKLDLHSNMLSGNIPPDIGKLKPPSLGNNSLSGQVPPNLGSLPSLDQQNISHNKLSGVLELPGDFIQKLGKMLDLRGNSELCISDQSKKKNLSSYLEIPSCLNTRQRNDNNYFAGTVATQVHVHHGQKIYMSSYLPWF
ncbi:Receptor like protein 29 [Glycine soja]|uniref:Receptor like protein 29 n=1 Tax=Glycine soja TaxID=3848 RepID=A0A445KND0_GLYSO|nr:Receptor like protein 29 [Glycine soja]